MKPPFRFGTIVSGLSFTDRDKESAWLREQWLAGNNCMVVSPRRWGKSSLVKHASDQFIKKHPGKIFCFLDLYNVRSEQEFYEIYSKTILKACSNNWQDAVRNAGKFFKHVVPRLSLDVGHGNDFSLGFNWQELKKDPSEVLDLPEKIGKEKKKEINICLDEFQNLGFFQEPLALQKRLRSHWQKHQHCSYCLYGSKRHLLMDFFTNASMPFYKFGEILFLQKIASAYWVPFINRHFKSGKRTIDPGAVQLIIDLAAEHPYYVQQLAQACWLRTEERCTEKQVESTLEDLLDQYGTIYQKEVDELTNTQVNFLRALCDKVEQLSSAKTISEYELGTSANVNRIKDALREKELIEISGNSMEMNDPLFRHWLIRRYFVNRRLT